MKIVAHILNELLRGALSVIAAVVDAKRLITATGAPKH